jgi:hypothetical protein
MGELSSGTEGMLQSVAIEDDVGSVIGRNRINVPSHELQAVGVPAVPSGGFAEVDSENIAAHFSEVEQHPSFSASHIQHWERSMPLDHPGRFQMSINPFAPVVPQPKMPFGRLRTLSVQTGEFIVIEGAITVLRQSRIGLNEKTLPADSYVERQPIAVLFG